MTGTGYVIEQLGQALLASHEVIAEQQKAIERLIAEKDDLVHLADKADPEDR